MLSLLSFLHGDRTPLGFNTRATDTFVWFPDSLQSFLHRPFQIIYVLYGLYFSDVSHHSQPLTLCYEIIRKYRNFSDEWQKNPRRRGGSSPGAAQGWIFWMV
jgi:hypothetical protein